MRMLKKAKCDLTFVGFAEMNKKDSYEVGLVALRVRAVYTKRLWGKTNYSNGPQCLYLPCKWCIQRIGIGLCGRLSAHPCPPPQERNRNTHCTDRSIEIDEISIKSIRRKCTGILFSAASNDCCLVDFDYIKYILTKARSS